MDPIDQKIKADLEAKGMRSRNSMLQLYLIIFVSLFIVTLFYLIYSEVRQPLFGKWPVVAARFKVMQVKIDSIDYFKNQYDSLLESNDILSENYPTEAGVFFEVQIGAFQNFDFEKYRENLANLKSENVDQLDKYTLGKFRKYSDATSFKKDIEKMGVTGAFIVGKLDGQRIEMAEALKASKSSKK